jgi:hypothetical protein
MVLCILRVEELLVFTLSVGRDYTLL